MATDATTKKPIEAPDSPFEFYNSRIGDDNQLDFSTLGSEEFMDQSMYWFIASTIEDVLLAAADVACDKSLTEEDKLKKFKDFGQRLRSLNINYKRETSKFIAKRLFQLAVYFYPNYAPVLARLLYYFAFIFTNGKRKDNPDAGALLKALHKVLRAILDRKTNEDKQLAILEAEYTIESSKEMKEKDLETLEDELTQYKAKVRDRIVNSAKFIGFLYLDRLISDALFSEFFKNLRCGIHDIYKYEALCNLALITGRFVREFDAANEGEKYRLACISKCSLDVRCGLHFFNKLVEYMERVHEKCHAGAELKDDSDSILATFKKLQDCVKMKTEKFERKKAKDVALMKVQIDEIFVAMLKKKSTKNLKPTKKEKENLDKSG